MQMTHVGLMPSSQPLRFPHKEMAGSNRKLLFPEILPSIGLVVVVAAVVVVVVMVVVRIGLALL